MLKKFITKSFLAYTILYTIFLITLKFILNQFNIEFMSWVYYFSSLLILIMTIIGTEQLLLKIKSETLKNISITISFILFLIIIYFFITASLLFYKPTHIIEKNNQKLQVTVFYWDQLHTIDYYDYINPLMRSTENIDNEIISTGSSDDPFEADFEYKQYNKNSWIHSTLKKYIDILSIIDKQVYKQFNRFLYP